VFQDRAFTKSKSESSRWRRASGNPSKRNARKIDSLIELLQGKLSSSVMQIVTRPDVDSSRHPKKSNWTAPARIGPISASTSPLRCMASARGWIKAPNCFSFFARGPRRSHQQGIRAETVRQSALAEGAAAMSEAEWRTSSASNLPTHQHLSIDREVSRVR